MEVKRKTRGRQKIPMRLIQNPDDRYASFSKRRLGLFKKACEVSTLCNIDIGVIVFSPTDNPFSFFSPSMNSVLERYVNPNKPLRMTTRAIDAHTLVRISTLNKKLDEVVEEKHALQKIEKGLKELDKARPKAWWEELPINSLNKEQVSEWIDWFRKFKTVIELQVQKLQNEAFNQQLQDLSASFDNYVPPPYDHAKLVDNDQFYIGDDTNMNQYYVPTLPLNLPGSGGGGQNYYGGGGGESSIINAHTNPNYFDQLLPSGMYDGSSSSNDVFYPDQYSSYVSPGDDDLFGSSGSGGGGDGVLEQYVFPAPAMVQGGVGETDLQFEDLLAAADANHLYFPDPLYHQFPTGAQDLSTTEETYHQGMDY